MDQDPDSDPDLLGIKFMDSDPTLQGLVVFNVRDCIDGFWVEGLGKKRKLSFMDMLTASGRSYLLINKVLKQQYKAGAALNNNISYLSLDMPSGGTQGRPVRHNSLQGSINAPISWVIQAGFGEQKGNKEENSSGEAVISTIFFP
ncbi:hypothetical protein M9H77_06260 [Catharanthus roseus]|uniref:Uncharacterized protein n=1 Tax=Catharanthus roseus TaxID=4058 RepID=A0ACC0BRL5_CATRO|nr:hypothetical protein M9H77_06260 [Catharanthus roseus]